MTWAEGVLEGLARVQFMLGKKQEESATEENVVNLELNPQQKALFEKTLASYRAGVLPDAE